MVKAWAAASLGLALTAAVGGCGGGDDRTPTAEPRTPAHTPTVASSPTRSPETIDGVPVTALEFGGEADLPADVALIIETGCWQCDGPTTGLVRVYRDPSGELRTDRLFDPELLRLPPRLVEETKGIVVEEPYITGFALAEDASDMIVSVCTKGYCGGLGFASADAESTVFRSQDGGMTWNEVDVLRGGYSAVAMARGGAVLASLLEADQRSGRGFLLFPGGDSVDPPEEGGQWWPSALPSGELVWSAFDGGRLLRDDGSEFLDLGDGASILSISNNFAPDPSGNRLALVWWWEDPGGLSRGYRLGIIGRDGQLIKAFFAGDFARFGAWLDAGVGVGNVTVSAEQLAGPVPDLFIEYLPALFELETGRVQPIPYPFLDESFPRGRNHIQAIIRGPFARVVDTGSCLNVRAEPDMGAGILDCAADRVLLRNTSETREVDGATWLRVVAPGGAEGWASTTYLER